MARDGFTSTAIRTDELSEDIEYLKRHDKRLPQNPSLLDVYRAWRRLAKREVRSPDQLRSNDGPAAGDGTVLEKASTPPQPVEPSSQPELHSQPSPRQQLTADPARARPTHASPVRVDDRPSAKLAQQITLERERSRTLWLRAINSGKLVPRPLPSHSGPAEQAASLSNRPLPRRFVCVLHRVIHEDGPCAELLEIQRETGLPLETVAKKDQGGGYVH
jgi:hypothetical protein